MRVFRSVLTQFIQEVRSVNFGSLSTLKYEDVINRTAQLILDHQEHSQVRQQFLKPIKKQTKYRTVYCIAQHNHPLEKRFKQIKYENAHTLRRSETK